MPKLETTADLQALIDGSIGESLHLDFKRGEALARSDLKKREMAKDVSAMANSDGGQIIYGIDEDGSGNAAGWAPPSDAKINADWIGQVLDQNISPRIEGLRIKDIAAAAGGTAFVVTAPRAIARAPHQASDKRYYRRHERESVPMHDYEVRDAMRRATTPDLRVELRCSLEPYPGGPGRSHRLYVVPVVSNLSSEPALYTSISILMDRLCVATTHDRFMPNGAATCRHPSGELLNARTAALTPTRDFPIFREQALVLNRLGYEYPDKAISTQVHFGYRIAAPGCERYEFRTLEVRNFKIFQDRHVTDAEPA